MYEASVSKQPTARIAAVMPGSIAAELDIRPGDMLLAVNGMPVSDYIAYRFAIADEDVTLDIQRGDERWEFEIEKEFDEDLGIAFESDVFDGVHRCKNRCVFCFEDQLPACARPSLRIRDDDFRLSFLHGNFLTLTNLKDGDLERIEREHLSPLHLSIHATELEVRRGMLRNRRAPDIMRQMRRLAKSGIELHGQIVFCPGWNDGAVLARTLDDLASLYPALQTVGIVPVGLSEHSPSEPALRAVTPENAVELIDDVECRQADLLAKLGTRQVFLADEFYLLAGKPLPPAEAYEGYPQYENGIGIARHFLDEMEALEIPSLPARRITLATGTLAAPLLEQFAERLRAAGVDVQVIAVPNTFFGGGVSVAGLLSGQDLLAALAGKELGDMLFLPACLRNADGIFLDDMAPADLEAALGVDIHFCDGPAEVVEILEG